MTKTNLEIEEEWRKFVVEDDKFESFDIRYFEKEIAEWWLSKLQQRMDEIEGMKKPEIVIEDCENCGNEGFGKAWYGKGAENDPHGYGDRYYPTGSVVFCKDCSNDFKIGKDWNGEEIWKRTSDNPEHDQLRLNSIKKKLPENVGYNKAISDVLNIIKSVDKNK